MFRMTLRVFILLSIIYGVSVYSSGNEVKMEEWMQHHPFGDAGTKASGEAPAGSRTVYYIYDWHDLQGMQSDVSGDYYLENDLDAETPGFDDYQSGTGFDPVGGFTGTFDGQGHIIDGLFIDRPAEDNVGLFGSVDGGTIEEVGMANVYVSGKDFVGALVGWNQGGAVSRCFSTGEVHGDVYGAGGLVGYNGDGPGGNITDCYSWSDVTTVSEGYGTTGGLVGFNADYGGESVMTNCYATGTIVGTNNHTGGLAGANHEAYGNCMIYNSFATGDVSGYGETGGLVGNIWNDGGQVNCWWNNHPGNPDHCYFGGDLGCTAVSNNESYFYNVSNTPMDVWDFDNIWSDQNDGQFFPILKWQEVPSTPTPTITPSDTPTLTPTNTSTQSPTLSPTSTPTESPTMSPTFSPTETPSPTPTITLTPTSTPTETPTLSPTPTDSPTYSPTQTPTLSPTIPPTPTPTEIPPVPATGLLSLGLLAGLLSLLLSLKTLQRR